MNDKTKGNLILLLTAVVWGTGFISQRIGNSILPPMTFNAIRQLMAVVVLAPLTMRGLKKSGYLNSTENSAETLSSRRKRLLLAGLTCGSLMMIGTMLQQIGLVTVSAGKSGFISDLYIVLVPLFSLAVGERVRLRSVVCIGIAMIGFAVMSLRGSLTGASVGDWLTLASAFAFAGQIVAVSRYVDEDNALLISEIQMIFVGTIGLVIALIAEDATFAAVWRCMPVLIYQTLFPTAIGFTLQIVGQKYTDSSTAALILSTEAVFAAIFGALVLHEMLTAREIAGAVMIMSAVILGQKD